MTLEIDIWRVANMLVQQHGPDAPTHAAQRVDELLAEGDMAGQRTWKLILAAARELLRTERGQSEHLN